MISKISIKNFRSIKSLDLDLDRITCIIGESYAGKSNILRAIKWALLNHPSGSRMIRWGKKTCKVSITCSGHKIVREKGKSVNSYRTDDLELEAFGNNVPDEVHKAFPVSEINFQTQQEMPPGEGPLFWFALSPGQISKKINKIVNLDSIDRTLSNIQSRARSVKSELQVCRDRKRQVVEKRDSLLFVDDLNTDWDRIVDLKKKSEEMVEQIERLDCILSDIQSQKVSVDKLSCDLKTAEKELQGIEKIAAAIRSDESKIQFLEDSVSDIINLSTTISDFDKQLQITQKMLTDSIGKECPLCGRTIVSQ